ncbi:uncharacterized protein LOC118145584 isoform X2 [Callithrix jacchus]
MERWLNRNSSSLLLPVRPTQKVISSFSDCVLGCAEVFKLSMHHLSSSCLHHKKKMPHRLDYCAFRIHLEFQQCQLLSLESRVLQLCTSPSILS